MILLLAIPANAIHVLKAKKFSDVMQLLNFGAR